MSDAARREIGLYAAVRLVPCRPRQDALPLHLLKKFIVKVESKEGHNSGN